MVRTDDQGIDVRPVMLWSASGTPLLTAPASLADNVANPSVSGLGVYNQLFDGTQWLRQRTVETRTLLTSASRTGDQQTTAQTNQGHKGVHLMLRVTSVAAPGVSVTIQGQNSLTGEWDSLFPFSAAKTATGHYSYQLYPGITAGTSQLSGSAVSLVLPKTWRVYVYHNGDAATGFTYSLIADMLV